MKRFLVLVIVAALTAVAILYVLRVSQKTPNANVVALLPHESIAFLHVPDFKRTRDQWHQSDIYQLYREPAVQDFLQKPLAKVPKRDTTSQTLQEIEQLDPKDGFVALISIDNNNPKFVGGFRFRGNQDEAEGIIGKWRSRLLAKGTKRDTVRYEEHKIDILGVGPNELATVYDGDWFFASNDLAELEALLDRANHHSKTRQPTLEANDAFRAAMAHMPSSYAALFYLQPRAFADKLMSLRAAAGAQLPADQRTMLEQMRSVCGAIRFDNGKIHDLLFVGMPKLDQNAALTRSSLRLGTKETFLYFATLLNVEKFAAIREPSAGTPFAGWLRKVFEASARYGMTVDDWKVAFELELGSLADWPENARWPSLIATLPVKDPVRANKIVTTLTSVIDEDVPWTRTEKDGVHYFFMRPSASLFAITPTIALSNRILVAGLDSVSVEATMKRITKSSGELGNSSSYKAAARSVPAPTNFFAYIDMPLLYSRLDAALRPMLLMSAAFMPAISDHIDVNKVPPPDLVTKHLSPIVSSQRYDGDGYVAESMGPITLNQAAIGLGVPAVLWAIAHQQGR
jgi:hypothetical protein